MTGRSKGTWNKMRTPVLPKTQAKPAIKSTRQEQWKKNRFFHLGRTSRFFRNAHQSFHEIENLPSQPSHTQSRSQQVKCVTGIFPTFWISWSPQKTNVGIDISPQLLNQLPKEVSLSSMPHSRNPFPKPAFYPQLKPPNWLQRNHPSYKTLQERIPCEFSRPQI